MTASDFIIIAIVATCLTATIFFAGLWIVSIFDPPWAGGGDTNITINNPRPRPEPQWKWKVTTWQTPQEFLERNRSQDKVRGPEIVTTIWCAYCGQGEKKGGKCGNCGAPWQAGTVEM